MKIKPTIITTTRTTIQIVENGLEKIAKNVLQVIFYPYHAYREAVRNPWYRKTFGLLALIPSYAITLGVIKGVEEQSLLFGMYVSIRSVVIIVGAYFLAAAAIYSISNLLGGKGSFRTVLSLWALSYLPTFCWFGMSFALYLLLPSTIKQSPLGSMLSILFVTASISLFLWKSLLYYLTLHIGMRLNFWRILIASPILYGGAFGYAVLMYALGWARVPFI